MSIDPTDVQCTANPEAYGDAAESECRSQQSRELMSSVIGLPNAKKAWSMMMPSQKKRRLTTHDLINQKIDERWAASLPMHAALTWLPLSVNYAFTVQSVNCPSSLISLNWRRYVRNCRYLWADDKQRAGEYITNWHNMREEYMCTASSHGRNTGIQQC